MIRDGYTCVPTGFQDSSHPKPAKGIPVVRLVGAHILRRAIGEFDNDHNSKSVGHLSIHNVLLNGRRLLYIQFKSAVTTFDMLLNFARLSVETLEELHDQLDNPSNGMILQKDAHDAFDSFYWCMKPTEVRFMTRNWLHRADDASRRSICTI